MSLAWEDPTDHSLTISEIVFGDVVRLELSGEIDMSNAGRVSDYARKLLDDPAVGVVVADLAAVGFLGSAGLAALVAARQHADRLAKTFYVEHARANVAEVIQVTGLAEFLSPQ